MAERTGRTRHRGTVAAIATAAVLGAGGCTLPFTSPSEPAPSVSAVAIPTPSASPSGDLPSRAPSGDDPAGSPRYARFYGQKLEWTGCGTNFQCASVIVPIDWDAPEGETVTVEVTRRPASKRSARIGTLFVNPGGPGVPGIEFAQAWVDQVPASVRAVYDVASWDTRGTGRSSAVRCLPDARLDAFYASDGTPDTPAERESLVSGTEEYVEACETNSGPLLEHMDTLSTVRDLDLLRALVGDRVLSYYGASYGTFIGAWYAETFPSRVGRLVLDGAVDPSADAAEAARLQAMGFARAVEAYVDDCLDGGGCPLRGSREDAYRQLGRLLADTDAAPLPTDDGRELTESLMITGMIAGMYSQSSWSYVTDGITAALQGDGTTLMALADFYLEREENGGYGQTLQVYSPIYCLDHADRRTIDQLATQAEKLAAEYPPFGASMGWGGVTCSEWPYDAVVPTRRLTAEGAAPIVVVGTTNDPATPYEASVSLAAQLSSGRLLTRVGEGHTGYLQGSRCTDEAVNAYLLRGTLPAEGLRCPT